MTNLSNCAKKYSSSNVYARKISCAAFILFNFYIHLRFCVSTNLINEFYFQMQVKSYLHLIEVFRCSLKKKLDFQIESNYVFKSSFNGCAHGIRICKAYWYHTFLLTLLGSNFHPFIVWEKHLNVSQREKKD